MTGLRSGNVTLPPYPSAAAHLQTLPSSQIRQPTSLPLSRRTPPSSHLSPPHAFIAIDDAGDHASPKPPPSHSAPHQTLTLGSPWPATGPTPPSRTRSSRRSPSGFGVLEAGSGGCESGRVGSGGRDAGRKVAASSSPDQGFGARWSPWTPRLRLSFPSASTTCTAGVAAGSGRHIPASVQELRAGRQRGQRHVLLQQDGREAHLHRQGPPLWRHQRQLEAQWASS